MPRHAVDIEVKVLERPNLNHKYLITFVMLILLSSVIISQKVYAISSNIKVSYTEHAGYENQHQKASFILAQTAFENKNYAYSARLLHSLAEKGHVQAQCLLANLFDAGLGVKKNEYTSFYWYSKAARAGVSLAQHNLAVAYAQGHGISADLSKAVIWWKRAAKAGNSDSQYNLGIIYATGRDSIKPDIAKALKWWRMAAINGDAAAQFNLGALYANGIGMSSRTCEASRWWKKSAENGFVQAEMALAILENKHDYDICR